MVKDERQSGGGNGWLDTAPTAGDAKHFLPGAGDGIDVNPDGVKKFASQANGEAADFRKSLTNGVMKLQPEAAKIGATFYEAEAFALDHGAGVEALGMFSGDAGKGLLALGTGATSIAVTYINGDATSAATMHDVESAFDVSGGKGMFNAPQGAAGPSQAATGGHKLDNVTPHHDNEPYTPYDPHAAKTIQLGDGSYTIPADGPNDLERLTPSDLQDVQKKFQDDLAKTAD